MYVQRSIQHSVPDKHCPCAHHWGLQFAQSLQLAINTCQLGVSAPPLGCHGELLCADTAISKNLHHARSLLRRLYHDAR